MAIQQKLFVNNEVLVNLVPPAPSQYAYTQVWQVLTNRVALQQAEVSLACRVLTVQVHLFTSFAKLYHWD